MNSKHAQSTLCLFVDAHWLDLVGYAYYCVCVHTLGIGYFKARGVKKDSIPEHNSTPDNFSILGWEDQGLSRTIKEAIYIRVNNPTFNRNIGKFNLNHIWDRVLLYTPGLKIANPQVYVHIHNNRQNQPPPTNGPLQIGIGHSGHALNS